MPDVFVAPPRSPPPDANGVPGARTTLANRLRLPHTPAHLTPHPEWQKQVVEDFKQLQTALHDAPPPEQPLPLPSPGDGDEWIRVISSRHINAPILRIVHTLDHVRVVAALDAIDVKMQEAHDDGTRFSQLYFEYTRILAGEFSSVWIYALLARVMM